MVSLNDCNSNLKGVVSVNNQTKILVGLIFGSRK